MIDFIGLYWKKFLDMPVAAKAALLLDLNSGRVLYSQNADERLYPASLTKIMTCMLALENSFLDETVTVSSEALEGLGEDSSSAGMLSAPRAASSFAEM